MPTVTQVVCGEIPWHNLPPNRPNAVATLVGSKTGDCGCGAPPDPDPIDVGIDCSNCLWKFTFPVTVGNITDGSCGSCVSVANANVPVSYNGTYFYAPYGFNYHWWRAESIYSSSDCGGVFASKSLSVFVGPNPGGGCLCLGSIVDNSVTDYLDITASSEIALQCGKVLDTPCVNTIELVISTATQFAFGACNLATIPVVVFTFSPNP